MVSFKEIVSWLKKLPEFLWTEPQKQDTKIRHLSYNQDTGGVLHGKEKYIYRN